MRSPVPTPIITSRCDIDFYKFTMANAAIYTKKVSARYELFCRDGLNLLPYYDEIVEQVNLLNGLKFTDEEIKFLDNIGIFGRSFIEFLKSHCLNSKVVQIKKCADNISITIEGFWMDVIWWETMILSIIGEIRARSTACTIGYDTIYDEILQEIDIAQKTYGLQQFPKFSDFGTRRRTSRKFQEYMVQRLWKDGLLESTSNVDLARKYNIPYSGTMAHEWNMAFLGTMTVDYALAYSMWFFFMEYKPHEKKIPLIMISDTFGADFFFKVMRKRIFYRELLIEYGGVRHDSGCPFQFTDRYIQECINLKIDPTTKTVVYSDSLTFDKIAELYAKYNGRIKMSFGIGSRLMHRHPQLAPPNAVIKMTYVNWFGIWHPTVKLSDSAGKAICKDPNYFEYVRTLIKGDWIQRDEYSCR